MRGVEGRGKGENGGERGRGIVLSDREGGKEGGW